MSYNILPCAAESGFTVLVLVKLLTTSDWVSGFVSLSCLLLKSLLEYTFYKRYTLYILYINDLENSNTLDFDNIITLSNLSQYTPPKNGIMSITYSATKANDYVLTIDSTTGICIGYEQQQVVSYGIRLIVSVTKNRPIKFVFSEGASFINSYFIPYMNQ